MPVELDLAVGCQLDHNSFICGGIGNKMCVYDVRMKRMLRVPLEVSGTLVVPVALVQITKIMRLGIQEMLVANINELLLLEMRMMKMKKVGRFEQDRICGLAIMN